MKRREKREKESHERQNLIDRQVPDRSHVDLERVLSNMLICDALGLAQTAMELTGVMMERSESSHGSHGDRQVQAQSHIKTWL